MDEQLKLNRQAFKKALRDKRLSQREFAELIDSSSEWLSRLGSTNNKYTCSIGYARRILVGLGYKTDMFDELFFWL